MMGVYTDPGRRSEPMRGGRAARSRSPFTGGLLGGFGGRHHAGLKAPLEKNSDTRLFYLHYI